jgi:hypothetical protein
VRAGKTRMGEASVRTRILFRDPDNLAIWIGIDKSATGVSEAARLSLINAEIQSICNDHVSTLDDALHKKSPRPNPRPRIFIEQGNPCSRILWLHWES